MDRVITSICVIEDAGPRYSTASNCCSMGNRRHSSSVGATIWPFWIFALSEPRYESNTVAQIETTLSIYAQVLPDQQRDRFCCTHIDANSCWLGGESGLGTILRQNRGTTESPSAALRSAGEGSSPKAGLRTRSSPV